MAQELSDDDVFGSTQPAGEMSDVDVFGKSAPISRTDRFMQGAADPYYGAVQLAGHIAPSIGKDAIDKAVIQREGDYQAGRQAAGQSGRDWYRTAGEFAGAVPALVGLGLTAPETIMGAIGAGAFTGAANSLMRPVSDENTLKNGGYTGEKVKDAIMGAATGGATAGAFNVAGRAFNPAPSEALKYLQDRGVTPTIGQSIGPTAAKIEDIAQPFSVFGQRRAVEQMNVAAYKEASNPVAEAFGDKGPQFLKAGFDGVKKLGDYLSDKFDAVKSQIMLPVDDALMTKLGQVASETAVPRQSVSNDLQNILSKDVLSRVDSNGVLTGSAYKDMESTLVNRAKDYASSSNADDRNLAKGIYDSLDAIRESFADANPQYAGKLQALNKGWAILTRIEGAVKANSENGVFTPAQLSSTVRTMDDAVRHRAFARGEALLQPLANASKEVLGNTYPNSGTPARMAVGALEGGGLSGLGFFHPGAAAGMASTGLAYTPWGQKALGSLFTQRQGAVAPIIGDVLRYGPLAAGASARALMDKEGGP